MTKIENLDKSSFLYEVCLKYKVMRSVIMGEFRVKLLILCIKCTELRWSNHLIRMLPKQLKLKILQARPFGWKPRDRPRTCCKIYVSFIAWEHIMIPKKSWRVSLERRISGVPSWTYCLHNMLRFSRRNG